MLVHVESHYYIDENAIVYSNASGELQPLYTFTTRKIKDAPVRLACHFCFGKGVKTRKLRYVHRMFAEAFIDNPDQKRYVCARDKCLTNVSKENLFWCTNPRGYELNEV